MNDGYLHINNLDRYTFEQFFNLLEKAYVIPRENEISKEVYGGSLYKNLNAYLNLSFDLVAMPPTPIDRILL